MLVVRSSGYNYCLTSPGRRSLCTTGLWFKFRSSNPRIQLKADTAMHHCQLVGPHSSNEPLGSLTKKIVTTTVIFQ